MRPLLQLYQRIGFLGTGGENTPRPMIFEAASHQVLAVRQKRRRQSITLETGVRRAVERELQRLAPIDPAAFAQAIDLAHELSPSALGLRH
jgi:hypothetical protein